MSGLLAHHSLHKPPTNYTTASVTAIAVVLKVSAPHTIATMLNEVLKVSSVVSFKRIY